jgi:hypothetical protein
VTMDVRWREWDWSQLRDVVVHARPAVRASLAASGLLKFFECPLIRAQEYLLQFLIEMWSPEQHCFLVRGEKITFTAVEDIYFLTGLPFRGTALPGRSCATERYTSVGCRRAILLRRTLYDWDNSVHQWDRCPAALLCSSYDSSGVWVPSDPPDQWR